MAIPRINVLDYGALGQKLIEWATSPDTRPKDPAELAGRLRGIVGPLPDYIKSLMFVQVTKDILLLRLPPVEFVEDTLAAIAAGGSYGLSSGLKTFYTELVQNNFYASGTKAQREKAFHFRVADYTIAHCW